MIKVYRGPNSGHIKAFHIHRMASLSWDRLVDKGDGTTGAVVRLRFKPNYHVHQITITREGARYTKSEWLGMRGWVKTKDKAVDFR